MTKHRTESRRASGPAAATTEAPRGTTCSPGSPARSLPALDAGIEAFAETVAARARAVLRSAGLPEDSRPIPTASGTTTLRDLVAGRDGEPEWHAAAIVLASERLDTALGGRSALAAAEASAALVCAVVAKPLSIGLKIQAAGAMSWEGRRREREDRHAEWREHACRIRASRPRLTINAVARLVARQYPHHRRPGVSTIRRALAAETCSRPATEQPDPVIIAANRTRAERRRIDMEAETATTKTEQSR